MLQRLFRPRPAKAKGQALYAAAVAQARHPELYAGFGVPDRIDARFELYTVHVVLLLLRLKGAGEEAAEVSQSLFDTYLKALDDALRELGVGDLAVARKMRRLGETIYARTKALSDTLEAEAGAAKLDDLLARTVFLEDGVAASDDGEARAARLGTYIREARDALARQPLRAVLDGKIEWPRIVA